jgi:hypothetical protein
MRHMAFDLNIRNFPEDLVKRAKITAVSRGVTLREYVIRLLSEHSVTDKALDTSKPGRKLRSQTKKAS